MCSEKYIEARRTAAAVLFLSFALCASSTYAQTAPPPDSPPASHGIQMMPPVLMGSTETSTAPCPPQAGTPLLLGWDGVNPVNCISGFEATTGIFTVGSNPNNSWGPVIASPNLPTNIGINTPTPAGTLDIENGAGTAQLCLNGHCASSLNGSTSVTMNWTQLSSYSNLCIPSGYVGGVDPYVPANNTTPVVDPGNENVAFNAHCVSSCSRYCAGTCSTGGPLVQNCTSNTLPVAPGGPYSGGILTELVGSGATCVCF